MFFFRKEHVKTPRRYILSIALKNNRECSRNYLRRTSLRLNASSGTFWGI